MMSLASEIVQKYFFTFMCIILSFVFIVADDISAMSVDKYIESFGHKNVTLTNNHFTFF